MDERWQSLRTTVPPTVVAIVAVAYATTDASWLSPTVRALLLAFLAIGLLVDVTGGARSSSARALNGLVAGGTLFYLLSERVSPALLLALAFLGVPLMAIWLHRVAEPDRRRSVAPRLRLAVVALLVVSGVALVGYDVVGPGVTYDPVTTTEGQVELPSEEQSPSEATTVRLALSETRVRNEFPLSRSVDLPTYDVCVAGDDADVLQRVRERTWDSGPFDDGVLPGNEAGSFGLYVILQVRGGPGDHVSVWVERGRNCDVDRDRPTLRYWRTE